MTLARSHGWLWWQVFWGWLLEQQDPETREYLARSLESYGALVEAGEFQQEWDQLVAERNTEALKAANLLESAQATRRKAAPGQTPLGEVAAAD